MWKGAVMCVQKFLPLRMVEMSLRACVREEMENERVKEESMDWQVCLVQVSDKHIGLSLVAHHTEARSLVL